MGDSIQEYVRSKGVETDKIGWEALQEQLIDEYGYIAPVFKNCSKAVVKTINIQEISFFEKYVETISARIPESSLTNGAGIVGIVMKLGQKYRLLDGNHRFKYCLEQNISEAEFIEVF